MKKAIVCGIVILVVIIGVGYIGYTKNKPASEPVTAPVSKDNAEHAFEVRRLEILTRYENARKQKDNDVLYDGDIIPQIGITMHTGDLCQLEENFFAEISAWRINCANSPEERALVQMEMRKVKYLLALQEKKMLIDDLESGRSTGSATPACDAREAMDIYREFNKLMLKPRSEAMKERQMMSAPLTFVCKGKKYEVDPGAGIAFPMYYKYAEENPEHETLFKVNLKKLFEYKGRYVAVFHFYRDVRGVSDSSGECFAVAELIDGRWKCLNFNLCDTYVNDCELRNGVVNVFYGYNNKRSSTPLDR